MDPIAKKKATVSPFTETTPNEPIEEEKQNGTSYNPIITDGTNHVVAPIITPNPDDDDDDNGKQTPLQVSEPIIRNQTNRSVAPVLPEYVSDIMAVDRRVEALIDYLEQWIRVGNLKMTDIKDYIQNYTV